MGIVLAATAAMCLWIILWAIGFGRTGDAFIVSVIPIVLLAVGAKTIGRGLNRGSTLDRD